MKNPYNLWPTKARLATEVNLGNRSELRKVQERFTDVETALDEPDYFTLLPAGYWTMNNVGGIYTINLHSDVIHSIGCQYVCGFSGKTAGEAARKCSEFVERMKGGDYAC
jgi:hypothetical protein